MTKVVRVGDTVRYREQEPFGFGPPRTATVTGIEMTQKGTLEPYGRPTEEVDLDESGAVFDLTGNRWAYAIQVESVIARDAR